MLLGSQINPELQVTPHRCQGQAHVWLHHLRPELLNPSTKPACGQNLFWAELKQHCRGLTAQLKELLHGVKMKAGTEPSPDSAQVHLCSCQPQGSAANTHKQGFRRKERTWLLASRRWSSGQQNAVNVVGRRRRGTGGHLGGSTPHPPPLLS